MTQQQTTIEEMRTEREMVAGQLIHLKEQREQLDASVTHLTGRYKFLDQEITRWAQGEMAKQAAAQQEAQTPETPATHNPFNTLITQTAAELAPTPEATNGKVSPIAGRLKRGKK